MTKKLCDSCDNLDIDGNGCHCMILGKGYCYDDRKECDGYEGDYPVLEEDDSIHTESVYSELIKELYDLDEEFMIHILGIIKNYKENNCSQNADFTNS